MASPEKPETLSSKDADLIHRMGVVFGLAATLGGGAIGAVSGKLSGRFAPAIGFVSGTLIAGAWTSVMQAVNYFRVLKTPPVETHGAAETCNVLASNEATVSGHANHAGSVLLSRTNTSLPSRFR